MLMQSSKGKVDRRKQVGGRVINSQHVTLIDMTNTLQLGEAIGTKIGIVQKGHNLIDCSRLCLQQRKEPTPECQPA